MKCASLNAVFSEKPQTTPFASPFKSTIRIFHCVLRFLGLIHAYCSRTLWCLLQDVYKFLSLWNLIPQLITDRIVFCAEKFIYFVTKSRNKENPKGLYNSEQYTEQKLLEIFLANFVMYRVFKSTEECLDWQVYWKRSN